MDFMEVFRAYLENEISASAAEEKIEKMFDFRRFLPEKNACNSRRNSVYSKYVVGKSGWKRHTSVTFLHSRPKRGERGRRFHGATDGKIQ